MSLERVIKALTSLGLSPTEAGIYIHLATHGPQNAEEIADALKLRKEFLSENLSKMAVKGILVSHSQKSFVFFALPFHRVLKILMKTHQKETLEMEKSKDDLLLSWEKMIEVAENKNMESQT